MQNLFSVVLLPLLASLGLALEPFAILSSQQAQPYLFSKCYCHFFGFAIGLASRSVGTSGLRSCSSKKNLASGQVIAQRISQRLRPMEINVDFDGVQTLIETNLCLLLSGIAACQYLRPV